MIKIFKSKNITYFMPAIVLAIVFICSAIFILSKPSFKEDVVGGLVLEEGTPLSHNVAVIDGKLCYSYNGEGDVPFDMGIPFFLAKVEIPKLNPGIYKYKVHYSSSTHCNVSVWVQAENYEGFESRNEGLYGYKNNTWSYLWAKDLQGVEGLTLCLVGQSVGDCVIDSIVVEEHYLWRVLVLLAELILFLLILFTVYAVSRWNRERICTFVVAVACIVLSCLPFFFSGLKSYGGHDYDFHISRIAGIYNELSYGHFPALYQSDVVIGYISLLMYGNIFLYIPAIIYGMGLPLSACFNLYFVILNIATTAIAWFSFKRIFTNKRIALLAMIVYSLAPYRLICIYIRAALGEVTAMAFIPLVMLGMYRIYSSDEKVTIKDWLPLVLGMSGIINSHILSTELVTIALLAFAILSLKKTIGRIVPLLKAVLLTVLINLFFLVPFIQSYGMNINARHEGNTSLLLISGLEFLDLFKLPVDDTIIPGIQYVLTVVIAFGVLIVAIAKRGKLNPYIVKLTILGAIAMFMSTKYFPWSFFQWRDGIISNAFTAIQFPYRYLSLVTALLSPVLAYLVVKTGEKADACQLCVDESVSRKSRNFVAACVVILLAFQACLFTYKLVKNTETILTLSAASAHAGDTLYLLEGVDLDNIDMIPRVMPEDGAIVAGRGADEHNMKIFEAVSSVDSAVTIPIVAYDYIHAIDVASGVELATSVNEINGMLTVFIPAGYMGTFGVTYVTPILWKIAYLVSGICLMLLVVFLYRNRYKASM